MELDSSMDCIGLDCIGLGHVIRIFYVILVVIAELVR